MRPCPTLGPHQESGYKEEAELPKIENGFSHVSPIRVSINYSNQQSHALHVSYRNKLLRAASTQLVSTCASIYSEKICHSQRRTY